MTLTMPPRAKPTLRRRKVTPVTATLRNIQLPEKLFAHSTERPAVFPAEVGDPVLHLAIGTLQALERIAVLGTTTKQIKRALRHYIEGMAHLLAAGLSGAQCHDFSGTPVEPVGEVRLLDFRKCFKLVKQRRDTIREAQRQLSAGATPTCAAGGPATPS